MLVILCLFWLRQMARLREMDLFVLFFPILLLTVVLPIIQHHFLQVLFPIERAALYYIPLFGLVLVFAASRLEIHSCRHWLNHLLVNSLLIAAFFPAVHFFRNFNFNECFTWGYDAHNKEVIELIHQDARLNFPGQIVMLCNSWQFEPSLNYYRFTRNLTWLAPVLRAPIGTYPCHYIYAFESDLGEKIAGKYQPLASYPNTNTLLLRLDRTKFGAASGMSQ
jgi:hypothetical protein